jgi:acetolactate synthase I/II/III large subunit
MHAPKPAAAPTQVAAKRLTAEDYLAALHAQGVDCLFANAGTDFPPIIEAFSRMKQAGEAAPRPITVPHENAAVCMAHGYYLMTGRPQALMVHVNVGTANTICALINIARDNIPLLLTAGRNPITETGPHGTRSRPIHWAQEMFDQAGMLREAVKWDYELHATQHAGDVVGRAMEIAMTEPRGPVYLTLPREVLAMESPATRPATRRSPPGAAAPNGTDIAKAAEWIAAAERPLIIAARSGTSVGGVEALAQLAERYALPVVSHNPRYVCLPHSHPMHLGFLPKQPLADADVVVVLDSDVPWILSSEGPPAGAKIIHIGIDPTFVRYPMRSYPSDLTITAAPEEAIRALDAALAKAGLAKKPAVETRRARIAEQSKRLRATWKEEAEKSGQEPAIRPPWISKCLGEVLGDDAVVFNEYPLKMEHCALDRPMSYFGLSPAGGLGWSLPAALGAKLAAPDKLCVATLGDGAYIFTNPTACHWVSAAHELPVLTIVFNNSMWGAVRNSTLAMYREGAAAKDNHRTLADLSPSPAFEKLVEAQGGYGEKVEKPADLPAALKRAVDAVRGGRQALLNVVCQTP